MLHLVIKSIMRQTVPPDRIIVWLSERHRRKKLGELYPPNTFSEEVFNEKVFLKLVPYDDDYWFTVMRLLNGKKAFQVDARKEMVLLPTYRKTSLAGLTKGDGRREFKQQLANLIRHYGMSL